MNNRSRQKACGIGVAAAVPLLFAVPLVSLLDSPAQAATAIHCPLEHEPYSVHSPLADLQINPATSAVLAQQSPDLVSRLTADHGGGDLPPGFAAILTPELLLRMRPDGPALTKSLNAALATIPLTPAAMQARCARYDNDRPALPRHLPHPALLVFDKINGFRDTDSVNAAESALRSMALRRGWTLVFSNKSGVFNPSDLKHFDAVIWNNVSGDALTLDERAAFKRWMEQGGGFAGIHGSAGDPAYFWDWYVDTLIGARFSGHPMQPQFQSARVVVEDDDLPITQGLGPEWTMTEEWYSFASSPRAKGVTVLARLDESSYSLIGFGGQDLHMGDHPIAWAQCVGRGRSFYTAIGHRPESYVEPHSLRLLEQGIAWAAGLSRGQPECMGTP